MNRKPDNTPRFAVDRAAMLAQLPGVRLAAAAKRFGRGRPKLDNGRSFPGSHAPAPAGGASLRVLSFDRSL
ncbi:MAG: hypothetical protein ACREIA_18425 [Opitutaceae bacterium]